MRTTMNHEASSARRIFIHRHNWVPCDLVGDLQESVTPEVLWTIHNLGIIVKQSTDHHKYTYDTEQSYRTQA